MTHPWQDLDRLKLIDRARYLEEENLLAESVLDRAEENTVGSVGFKIGQ